MTPVSNRKIPFFLTCIVLLTGALGRAEGPTLQVKDWSMTDSEVCSISVTEKRGVFKVETYTLQISKAKNKPQSPAEVTIFLDDNKRDYKGVLVAVPSTSSELPFSLLKSEGSATFWGVPRNLSGLINDLKTQSSVAVRSVGGDKEVSFKFSSKGFNEVLAEIEKRCNGGTGLVSAEFESLFLSGVSPALDPTKISIAVSQQLRTLYFQAFPLFQQLKETQAGLRAVLAKYQAFIDEQAQVRASLSQIQNVDLPQTRQALAAAQKQQVDATAEIQKLTAQLPGLQAQVQSAQKSLDQVQAVLSPLVPEFNRLSQALSQAQDSLSQAQSRLAQIDSRLPALSNELSSLRAESDSLQRATSQERFQLSDAQNAFSVAQSRRANFNVSAERERRLQSHSSYRSLQDERSSLISQAQQNERQLNEVRGERARIVQMLEQCRAVPAGSPPADCSQLEQALSLADQQIAGLQSSTHQLQSRLNEVSNQISEIDRQITQQVQREYQILLDREQECRQQVVRLEDQLRRDENRLSQLINSEIPNREREQSQLQSERPQVVSQMDRAQRDVQDSSNRLAAFKSANDWDRKKAAVDLAARDLRKAQEALASVQSQKKVAEARLQAGANDEARLKARISELEGRVITLTQRDSQLSKLLANLPAERAPFDQKIASLQSALSNLRDQFLNLIR